HRVHLFFELALLGRRHLVHAVVFAVGRGGELRADVEQLVLNPAQHLRVSLELIAELRAELRQIGAHDADYRVKLVNRTVGLEPRAIFRYALAADQRRESLVAAARVDAVQADRHQSPAFLRSAWYAASPVSVETGRPQSRHPLMITVPC